jgi:hypothetical protein
MTSAANAGSIKAAIEKIGVGMFARQWVGNAAALLLAFAWLRVPDSHAWQFLLSVVFGLAIVAAFLWLHATTFRRLRSSTLPVPTPVQLLILVCIIFFWMFLLQPISATRSFEPLLAGYVNSKLSPEMRSFFTFARLVQWQEYFLDLLEWLIAGLLLPAAMAAVATERNTRTFRGLSFVYQRWQYWAAVFICGFAGERLTAALVSWTPGKGLVGETLSVVTRFALAYTADILLWCFVLALTAVYLDRGESMESHPLAV